MKTLQRMLSFVLALTMVMCAAGCHKSENPGEDESSDLSTEQTDSDVTSGDKTNSEAVSTEPGKESSTSTQTNAKPPRTQAPDNKKLNFNGATVTMIFEWQPLDKKGIDASRDRELDRIAELNKKYNVKIVMKKGSSNYNEGIVSSIAAGAPIGNIIRVGSNGTYDFIRAGLCANLNDGIKESKINVKDARYNFNKMNAYNVNNKQYVISCVVPQESNSGDMWYYNKSILKELGYKENYISELCKAGKWNWQAVTKLAEQAAKVSANGSVSRYGIGYVQAYRMAQNMVIANGATIGAVAKNGTPLCNFRNESVKQAFEQLYNWGNQKQGVLCTSENDGSASKFGKGEIFMMAGGDAKTYYNSGVNFGAVYPPKGPRASGYIINGYGSGANFIIPVTYQKEAGKYLALLNELYAPYPDASREDIMKADQINYFNDKDSWNFYRNASFDTKLKRQGDLFEVFNLQWTDPAFATVCQNLVKGSLTAGTLVEKYNDQYQAILDDLFKGYKLTGIK